MPHFRAALLACVAAIACGGAPVAPPSAADEPPATPMLRSSDLRFDLDVLSREYRALHPGLSRYLTPAQLDGVFAAAERAFSRDRSLADAFVELTRLTAAIRCGHSYPNPSNQSHEVAAALFARPRISWLFEWRDGEMLVTRNLARDSKLRAGAIVEAIDGVSTKAIFTQLMPLARADGGNDRKRAAEMAVVGDGEHEAFDILAPWLFPQIFAAGELQLRTRTPAGTTELIIAPLISPAERTAALDAPAASPDVPAWHVEWNGTIAYLRMASWVTYHSKRDWRADMRAIMDEIVARPASALIVDLRGNEGGSDVGDEILARLISAPLTRSGMHRRTRFRSVDPALRPYLDTWDPSFFELGSDATPVGDGWFELPSEPGTDIVTPRSPSFAGKLVVLIDSSNSSATFQFALTLQQHHLATLVGSPTGGSQRGINGGAFFFIRLPRTGLEVDLPLIGTFPDGVVPDAGVTPEVEIVPSPADLAAGVDSVLRRAYQLADATSR